MRIDRQPLQYLLVLEYQCLTPAAVVAVVFLLYITTVVLYKRDCIKHRWDFDKVLNTIGQMLEIVYIRIAAIVVVPLQCYQYPNGRKSLSQYPQVLCWEDDHRPLLGLAGFVLFCFVIPFACVTLWGSFFVVKPGGQQMKYTKRLRFLLFRFRPDYWWWGNVFNVRQLALVFVSSLPVEDPYAQAIYVNSVLGVYLVLTTRYWP